MFNSIEKVEKKFYIIKILNNSPEFKKLFVVPGTFMLENQESGDNFVYIIPPPHSSSNIEVFKSYVQSYTKPPATWPIYLCKIICTAGEYEHATVILKALKNVESQDFLPRTTVKRDASGQIIKYSEATNVSNDLDQQFQQSDVQIADKNSACTTVNKILKEISTQTDSLDCDNQLLTNEDLNKILRNYFSNIEKFINDKVVSEIKKIRDIYWKSPQPNEVDYILTFNEFSKKHSQYDFPLKSQEEFNQFVTDIQCDDNSIREDLKKYLAASIKFESGISDNLSSIFKKFLSKEVIKDYTPQRPKPGKLIFKDTEFYLVLEDTFLQTYNSYFPRDKHIQSKHMLTNLGLVFNNAKDWDGGRAARSKKYNSIENFKEEQMDNTLVQIEVSDAFA